MTPWLANLLDLTPEDLADLRAIAPWWIAVMVVGMGLLFYYQAIGWY